MLVELPADWQKTKQVPTSRIEVLGGEGNVVATIAVTGAATCTTTWPYTYRIVT